MAAQISDVELMSRRHYESINTTNLVVAIEVDLTFILRENRVKIEKIGLLYPDK